MKLLRMLKRMFSHKTVMHKPRGVCVCGKDIAILKSGKFTAHKCITNDPNALAAILLSHTDQPTTQLIEVSNGTATTDDLELWPAELAHSGKVDLEIAFPVVASVEFGEDFRRERFQFVAVCQIIGQFAGAFLIAPGVRVWPLHGKLSLFLHNIGFPPAFDALSEFTGRQEFLQFCVHLSLPGGVRFPSPSPGSPGIACR